MDEPISKALHIMNARKEWERSHPVSKRRGRKAGPPNLVKCKNFTFRLRSGMGEKLKEAAKRMERTMSEEIEYRLTQSFDADAIAAVIERLERNMKRMEWRGFGEEAKAFVQAEIKAAGL